MKALNHDGTILRAKKYWLLGVGAQHFAAHLNFAPVTRCTDRILRSRNSGPAHCFDRLHGTFADEVGGVTVCTCKFNRYLDRGG